MVGFRNPHVLYVHSGSKSLYQKADNWKEFLSIIDLTTNIPNSNTREYNIIRNENDLIISNVEIGNRITVYTYDGQKVKELISTGGDSKITLPHGIYLIKIVNFTKKILI